MDVNYLALHKGSIMFKRVGLVACLFMVSSQAPAQQTQAPQQPADVEPQDARGGVEFALKRYIVVFNSHDPAKLAQLWTPEAVYVDRASGVRTEGRAALA